MQKKDLKIQKNVLLNDFTTFKLGGFCSNFCIVNDGEQIPKLVDYAKSLKKSLLILGGGSNIIIDDQLIDRVVLKIEIKGIKLIKTLPEHVLIRVGAGVIWDDLVNYTVENGYWGAENMSLIPGTVGATPVQNVGAYGQDVGSIISVINVYDLIDSEFKILTNEDCKFTWRNSIFNTIHKNRYIIISVDFKFKTDSKPNLKRIDLQKKYNELLIDFDDKSSKQSVVRNSVIALRTSGKNLPLSDTDFNVGTFFQASLIKKNQFTNVFFNVLIKVGLKTALKVLFFRTRYKTGKNFKIPSALLIESTGSKKIVSKRRNFKLFDNNPTVLIHNGKGSADEFKDFIELIRNNVLKKTGVILPIEPEFINIKVKI